MQVALNFWILWVLFLPTFVAGDQIKDLTSEFLSAYLQMKDCPSCHTTLVPLKKIAQLGDPVFVKTLTTICTTFKVSSLVLGVL